MSRELLKQALDALLDIQLDTRSYFQQQAVADIRQHLAQPQPEPVAWLCENAAGHKYFRWKKPMSEYKPKPLYAHPPAQPAPVPLTDTETHAELWKLAVRKGLITVRSELIDPRNHGTRVSWMQGHDKACDISNEAAAHGIAASPEQPK